MAGKKVKKLESQNKSCTICGETFPMTEFSYGNRDQRSYCKEDNREDHRVRNLAKKEGKDPKEAARKFREMMHQRKKGMH